MLEAWKDYHLTHSNAGRPPKLSRPNQLLVALQYWREYRTYFHIASDWDILNRLFAVLSSVFEAALMGSGHFRLPGKKRLLQGFERPDVVVIDVTETPIERPSKGQKEYYSGKKRNTPSNARLLPTVTL